MSKAGLYKMRTMVRLTGLSPSLLRAWERRHKLLEPARGEGGHRLYTEDDLRVLRQVQRMLKQGRSIGEIAVLGREALLSEEEPSRSVLIVGEQAAERAAIGDEAATQLERCRAAIVEAALAVDSGRLERVLDEAFSIGSPPMVVEDVIRPAAHQIGALWVSGQCSVACEHLASEAFVLRLRKLVETASSYQRGPALLCSCFPDERHQLGLLMLAYRLSQRGARITYLGTALPLEDLEGAYSQLAPEAVLLSVTRQAIFQAHRPQLLEFLRRIGKKTRLFVGGQGAPAEDAELTAAGARLCPPEMTAGDCAEAILQGQ